MITQQSFYDICYDLLLRTLNVPDVVSTVKDIQTGLDYKNNFPWETNAFLQKKDEIIFYIKKMRVNNVIDSFREKKGSLALAQLSNGKPLEYANQNDLYGTLDTEILRLVIKGMYYLIKHYFPNSEDEEIVSDLFLNDTRLLEKYNLILLR